MFRKLFEEQDEIQTTIMYMADGFRESHGYTENGEIETIRNAEHGNPFTLRIPSVCRSGNQ